MKWFCSVLVIFLDFILLIYLLIHLFALFLFFILFYFFIYFVFLLLSNICISFRLDHGFNNCRHYNLLLYFCFLENAYKLCLLCSSFPCHYCFYDCIVCLIYRNKPCLNQMRISVKKRYFFRKMHPSP